MKMLIAVLVVGVSFALVGCQHDIDLGTYSFPRMSSKVMYKGQDETENHYKSRDTGVFANGHTVIVKERANKHNFLPMVGEDK